MFSQLFGKYLVEHEVISQEILTNILKEQSNAREKAHLCMAYHGGICPLGRKRKKERIAPGALSTSSDRRT